MTYYLYILYSSIIDKYYIGYTCDIENRIKKHNTNHKGYTGKIGDWSLKYKEEYPTKEGARKREIELKNWKSRKQIEKLLCSLV